MEEKFNYSDFLKSSNSWFSEMNNGFLELTSPVIKVFKLDKKATAIDDFYGSPKHSRVFLPPFEIRAKHLTNPWRGLLSAEPYKEEEEPMKFELNFNNMVKTIRELKFKKKSSFFVIYSGSGVPYIENKNGLMKIFINGTLIQTYGMKDGTTSSLVSSINENNYFKCISEGDIDSRENVVEFEKTAFKNEIFNFYTLDPVYKNCTDIIEMGDAILTNKYRIYQVMSANPSGDFGWNYATFSLSCELYEMEELDGLPGDYRAEIEKRQWGMIKLKKE